MGIQQEIPYSRVVTIRSQNCCILKFGEKRPPRSGGLFSPIRKDLGEAQTGVNFKGKIKYTPQTQYLLLHKEPQAQAK